MNYKIINIQVVDETLNTEIEYTFADGSTNKVIVSHFMPEDKKQVLDNIGARGLSEETRKLAIEKNELIKAELSKLMIKENENIIE